MADMTSEDRDFSRTALILYASETGNSQDVAEELGRLVERLRFTTHVSELNAAKAEHLCNYALTIFAVSTTGQGDIPANGRTFWKSLLLKRLPQTYLQGVDFVLFGLGDSSYPKFNWAARKFQKRLLQLGAHEIYPCGEADEQHPDGLDGTCIPWTVDLRKHLLDTFPLKPGEQPIPDDVRLPPKWVLAHYSGDSQTQTQVNLDTMPSNGTVSGDYPKLLENVTHFPHFERDIRPIPDTVTATLAANTRVTPQDHWQDVRHLILTLPESIPYVPGDILYLTPKNFSSDVNTLITLMGWEEQADIPLQFHFALKDTSMASLSSPQIPYLQSHPGFTLRTLLTDYLDIMAIPRRSFFASIAHFTDDPMHKERLLEFTNPEFIDEFYDYTTRPRRSILEILHEFDSVKIPWQEVCSVFPVLRGRQFSIASGGKLKTSTDGGTRFDLLIAIVKYKTIIKKIREGVCTRYISVLKPGSTLKIQVQRGGLNTTAKQLLQSSVLIGPGTGVAPIRSLLWEKAALAESFRANNDPGTPLPFGPIILLFGGRNRASDFFFESEWEELSQILDLRVLTAFSRDQRLKIYVQDVIRQNYGLFFRMLHDQDSMVYICGSSGKMPLAIREALTESLEKGGGDGGDNKQHPGFSREAAEKYLMDMEKVGRYKQETW